jgi:hypothetical protein
MILADIQELTHNFSSFSLVRVKRGAKTISNTGNAKLYLCDG